MLEIVEVGEKLLRDTKLPRGMSFRRAAGRNQADGTLRHVDDEAADAGDGVAVPFIHMKRVVFAGAARVGELVLRRLGELGQQLDASQFLRREGLIDFVQDVEYFFSASERKARVRSGFRMEIAVVSCGTMPKISKKSSTNLS